MLNFDFNSGGTDKFPGEGEIQLNGFCLWVGVGELSSKMID